MEKKTSWCEATTNANSALISLITCLDAGHNAWIEVQKNGEQTFPIKMKNPALDDVRNWQLNFGSFTKKASNEYFNKTEKDLAENWVWVHGEPKAVIAYQKDGTILPGFMNFPQVGTGYAVKRDDANAYRKSVLNDGFDYWQTPWQDNWKPKDGVPYYVTDDRISEVFVICYNDEPYDKADSILAASEFLRKYGEMLMEQEQELEDYDR